MSWNSTLHTKDLFALGVLVNFGKVFKYLAASEHLGQFTTTIMKVTGGAKVTRRNLFDLQIYYHLC